MSRGFVHDDGIMGTYRGRKFAEIPDGTANTLLLGENYLEQTFGAVANAAGTGVTNGPTIGPVTQIGYARGGGVAAAAG